MPLTRGAADEYEPAFSPDGSRIAFRSNRDGGGIYVMAVLGGEGQLVASGGRRPRFSPDGKWLAYWVGLDRLLGETYVIPVAGGQPRKIRVGNPEEQTRSPVWCPDGRRLLVAGETDWWVVPLDGSSPTRTGVRDQLHAASLHGPEDAILNFVPEQWMGESGSSVTFSAVAGDARNLWKVDISPRTWRAAGRPERVTSGTEAEQQSSLSMDGRLVFAGLSRMSNIWLLPADTNDGRATGDARAITQEARQLTRPDISRDGRTLVYQDEKPQSETRARIGIRDIETGIERRLPLASAEDQMSPVVTADGSRVLYLVPPGKILSFAATGGVPQTICEVCDLPNFYAAFSPTGDRVAHITRDALVEITVRTGATKRITAGAQTHRQGQRIYDMRYSPDGRWLAFHTNDGVRRQIFLVDVASAAGTGDARWTPGTTEPSNSDGRVAWSPGGSLLYFVSNRDGYDCIWAQHLDPDTKRPRDPPFAVYHLHQTARRLSHNIGRVGLAVAQDRIVLAIEETRGNVWMLEPRPSR